MKRISLQPLLSKSSMTPHFVDTTNSFICSIFLASCFISNATIAANNSYSEKAIALQNIQKRIKEIELRIKSAQDETNKSQQELRDNEINTTETLTDLHIINAKISEKKSKLEEMLFEQAEHDAALKEEKEKLIDQIRAAYQIGHNDYLRLILNQEHPALVRRVLAYYDYHNRIRSERIEQFKESLISLEKIQSAIKDESVKLEELKLKHKTKLSDFHEFRATRRDINIRLAKYIEEQGIKLQIQQENERQLRILFQGLKKNKVVTKEVFKEAPRFNTLKGKLNWPVKGTLSKEYGANKKSGDLNLKWQGVLINAEMGAKVTAISSGEIIFAEWFRHLGLLIIIDHGDSFMSLYGHNQNILKNMGDWVLADEAIATVGDSGGQSDTALYFEIRKGAEPINPSHWCKW